MPILYQISFWQINPHFTSAEKVEELNLKLLLLISLSAFWEINPSQDPKSLETLPEIVEKNCELYHLDKKFLTGQKWYMKAAKESCMCLFIYACSGRNYCPQQFQFQEWHIFSTGFGSSCFWQQQHKKTQRWIHTILEIESQT